MPEATFASGFSSVMTSRDVFQSSYLRKRDLIELAAVHGQDLLPWPTAAWSLLLFAWRSSESVNPAAISNPFAGDDRLVLHGSFSASCPSEARPERMTPSLESAARGKDRPVLGVKELYDDLYRIRDDRQVLSSPAPGGHFAI